MRDRGEECFATETQQGLRTYLCAWCAVRDSASKRLCPQRRLTCWWMMCPAVGVSVFCLLFPFSLVHFFPQNSTMEHLVSFIAGASFGATSVLVGQPLDTVKTRMQAHQQSLKSNPLAVATEVFRKEGVRGLYRGGMPIFVGGALFRSAQFGVYEAAMKFAKVGSTEDGTGFVRSPCLIAAAADDDDDVDACAGIEAQIGSAGWLQRNNSCSLSFYLMVALGLCDTFLCMCTTAATLAR